MATEVSSQNAANQQPPQQQAPSSQAQPSPAHQQSHQAQGVLSTTQGQSHGTRQYVATSRPSNRNRGYNHNNSNSRGYNNDRNQQQSYGAGVKVHYNSSMSGGNGGGGYQNPNRYPMIRHFNGGAPSVTLAPNPSFTLSNQMVPAASTNHFSQNQFSGISNQSTFEDPGHGLLQSPGQNFDPQQQGQQLTPHRNQMQWSNAQIPAQNGLPIMDQPHAEMNGGSFGENTIGNYQSQQLQQQQTQPLQQQQPQFPPAQTTYFPYHAQFGGGQTAVNPNMFFPHLNQFYANPAQNFIHGFGHGFPLQFMNPSAYNLYGSNAVSATGNGHGSGPYICSICKQSMQASEIQAATEMAVTENKASIEPAQE